MYNLRSGTSKFEVGWISRASANQVQLIDAGPLPLFATTPVVTRGDTLSISELAELVALALGIAIACTHRLCMAPNSKSLKRQRCFANLLVRNHHTLARTLH